MNIGIPRVVGVAIDVIITHWNTASSARLTFCVFQEEAKAASSDYKSPYTHLALRGKGYRVLSILFSAFG